MKKLNLLLNAIDDNIGYENWLLHQLQCTKLELVSNQEQSDGQECARMWLTKSDSDYRDKLLGCGTLIVAELRMQVLKETGFTCSAGIAHNKAGWNYLFILNPTIMQLSSN